MFLKAYEYFFQPWQIKWIRRVSRNGRGSWFCVLMQERAVFWGSAIYMSVWVFCRVLDGWPESDIWWIALTKVWLSKARKKNAISHSNEVMPVFGGKTWYLTGYRRHWNDTSVKVRICVCVCVCAHYIVILTQWDMTKKSHFLDTVWVMWWKWDYVMKVPVTNKMMWKTQCILNL